MDYWDMVVLEDILAYLDAGKGTLPQLGKGLFSKRTPEALADRLRGIIKRSVPK